MSRYALQMRVRRYFFNFIITCSPLDRLGLISSISPPDEAVEDPRRSGGELDSLTASADSPSTFASPSSANQTRNNMSTNEVVEKRDI